MCAFYVSPLVDIKEVDLSTTVSAVASSVGALVVRNPWMGKENVKMFTTNAGEFIDTWGKPTENLGNYCDILSGAGFHTYGNALWSVGVRPPDATFAGLASKSTGTAQLSASPSFTQPLSAKI